VAKQRSILIVDDEFGLAEMMREMLREHTYEVSVAINGRLALDILSDTHVDLVITDIMMPVMDGAELAKAIRTNERLCTIPVVVMTSLPSSSLQHDVLYDAVLRKPFTPERLLATLTSCLSGMADVQESRLEMPRPRSPERGDDIDSSSE
jgi:CheY-like chemotaxis protein